MKSMKDMADEMQPINEELVYDELIQKLTEAKNNNMPLDEGLFGSIFGGLVGATAGPAIMKAVCKVLGIDENGSMGSLLTSRLVLTGLGAILGWKR